MRLGAISLQSEDGVEFASRRKSTYRTDDGETFEVVFSADAEIPEVWESPKSGSEGRLIDEDGKDRKSVGEGRSVHVRVDLGGRRILKKQKHEIKRADVTD